MRKTPHLKPHDSPSGRFEERRTIDVTDRQCLQFWSERLGVSADEIEDVVRQVGPNATAVALKLEAPCREPIGPPGLPLN